MKTCTLWRFTSLRDGNDNRGRREGFFGEVYYMLLSTITWPVTHSHVDSARGYLGDHSAGGRLAMLVAKTPGGFRALFGLG